MAIKVEISVRLIKKLGKGLFKLRFIWITLKFPVILYSSETCFLRKIENIR